MMRTALVVAALSALGCQVARPPAAEPATAPATASAPPAAAAPAERAACAPHEALDRMDARMPVPLLPRMANHQKVNMRDHLVAVQEIVAGAARGDFPAVERAAGRIGYSQREERMCAHMSAGAPAFQVQAVGFHRSADAIAAAARKRDRAAVLGALATTLQTCTACHATWKQQVVDDGTWARLTGGAPPPPVHRHP